MFTKKLFTNIKLIIIVFIILIVSLFIILFNINKNDITGTYERIDRYGTQKIIKITDNDNATLYNINKDTRLIVPEKIIKEKGIYYFVSDELGKNKFEITDNILSMEIINKKGKNEIVKYKKVNE